MLRVGPELGDVANVFSVSGGTDGIVDRFPKVFSGVGKLSGYQLKLHIDPEVRLVAQKLRRIPYPLQEKVTKKINQLLDLDIIEKVWGPTTWVSPAVFAPKPGEDDVRICVDMRCATETMQREKILIPTVDEVPEELNGSTVFSKLDMNMGFHQIKLDESSSDITIFSAGDSLFRYKRLSFDINSAPEQYQNIVQDKCKIGMSQIVFMGLILKKYGVGPTEKKVKAIRETKESACIEDVSGVQILQGLKTDNVN